MLIWDLVTLPFCTFLARFTSSWPSTMALSTSSWSLLHIMAHSTTSWPFPMAPSAWTPSWPFYTFLDLYYGPFYTFFTFLALSTPSWPVFKTQSDHIARFLQSKVFMLRAFKNTKQSCCTFLRTQCVNVVFSKMLSVHVAF